MPWVGLQCVMGAFPGHTRLLTLTNQKKIFESNLKFLTNLIICILIQIYKIVTEPRSCNNTFNVEHLINRKTPISGRYFYLVL